VPHVASKASVLHSQQSGLSRRERTAEANEAASPFSILLTETGSPPPPTRYHSSRPNGSTPTQRDDAPRNPTHHTNAQRPQRPENEGATDAPETTELPEDAAIDRLALAAKAEPVAVTPEQSTEPLNDGSVATAEDDALPLDAALAPAVEAPASPTLPASNDTAPPVVAAAPPADASDPTAPSIPVDTDTSEPAAVAPAGKMPPVTPDAAVGAGEPVPPQVPQQQVPQQTDHAAQEPNTPATPHARPTTERAAAPASADLPQPSTTSDAATTDAPSSEGATPAAATATDPEQAETKSAPKDPTHADTPSQPSARPNTPDAAADRPQTGKTVRDVIDATQSTTDPNQLAHLQRDVGQTAAATTHASQSANASNPLTPAPVPLESLAVEIATRVQPGRSRFEIRLDPPELGRVEVRLDIDRSGNVTSRLVVEKAETLDVLRRDAHQLERALQDAGLKTSDNSLQFSLRDQAFAERRDQNGSDRQHVRVADAELPAAESAAVTYGLTLRGGSGVDIRV
jgi:flagellar hook-length control protein FliK